MEFHIEMSGAAADVGAITEAVLAIDPAALTDRVPGQNVLRIAAAIGAGELVALIEATGYPSHSYQVIQIPSTCCGGCGG